MNYYGLLIAVCLATLFLAAAAGAVMSAAAEGLLVRASRRGGWTPQTRARALFVCRMAPLVAGVAVTFAWILPAFLALEPARTAERIGIRLAVLATLGGLAVVFAIARVALLWWRSAKLARRWMSEAVPLHATAACTGHSIYEVASAGGLVATAGVLRPRVFVSAEVVRALSEAELAAAIAHEAGHISGADNLKRLLLRAATLRRSAAERLWIDSSEMAADDAALTRGAPAIELASALVKVARLKRAAMCEQYAISSLVPAGMDTALARRVRRLTESTGRAHARSRRFGALWVVVAMAIVAMALQPAVLQVAHELIERLV